jgi:phasin
LKVRYRFNLLLGAANLLAYFTFDSKRWRRAMTDKNPYEIPTEMRDFAEKSVDQARKAIDGFIGAAHKAVDVMQGTTNNTHAQSTDASRKAISYTEQNIAAAFDLAQNMVKAKDLNEVMALQSEFMRQQMSSLQTQMKDIGSVVQKAASEAGSTMQKAASDAQKAAAETGEAVKKATASAMKRKS